MLGFLVLINKIYKTMKFKISSLLPVLGFLPVLHFLPIEVLAQDLMPGIAISINTGINLATETGLLVCQDEAVYKLCDQENTGKVVGITTLEPDIQIESSQNSNQTFVVQSGTAFIKVSENNGPVLANDLLTTSNTPGVAQKANDDSDSVFAIAVEDADKNTGTVVASIQLSPAVGTSRFEGVRQGLDSIPTFLRALLAALVVVTTFVIAALSFKKTSQASMEALGRNPLAKSSIQAGLLINTIATAAFAFVGLAAGYVIIIL